MFNEGDWTVNAFVRNITVEVIASSYLFGSGNASGSAYEDPRTVGVSVS